MGVEMMSGKVFITKNVESTEISSILKEKMGPDMFKVAFLATGITIPSELDEARAIEAVACEGLLDITDRSRPSDLTLAG
eukprot:jgi/Tetstr1/457321/TSEL_043925.t1